MVDTVIEKVKCTGCKMCAEVCPHNAISFEVNKEGYRGSGCEQRDSNYGMHKRSSGLT